MIRRLSLPWPGGSDLNQGQPPVRLLAVSDEREPALEFSENKDLVAPLDAVIGCGDLEPDYLDYLANCYCVPLLYVRGNHDRGANWSALRIHLPSALDRAPERLRGLTFAGLSWPAQTTGRAVRDELAAWRQALNLVLRQRPGRPLIMVSHVPPRGLGDTPEDVYHRGFAAYHWLCRRLQPMLWLHGHTSMAAADHWRVAWGGTTFVNVTGAVLVEIGANGASAAQRGAHTIGDESQNARDE